MKNAIAIAAMIAFLGTSSGSTPAESTEQELVTLEKDSYAAIIAKDYRTIRLLVAGDWIQQDDSDDKITRELMIGRLQSAKFVPESGVFDRMTVDVFGDVATVMGTVHERFIYAGKRYALHSNFMDVWQKRSGQWVTIRSQMASRKEPN